MTLSDFVKKYCFENGMSQRRFAAKVGLSTSTVNQIFSGVNPINNVPVTFQLRTYAAIAEGLGIPMQEFLYIAGDDLPNRIRYLDHDSSDIPSSPSITPDESTLLSLFRSMDPEGRSLLLSTATAFAATHPARAEKEA